jgi:hypothetical protein
MKLWKWMLLPVLLLCLTGCAEKKPTPEQIAAHYVDRPFHAVYTVTTHAGFYTAYQLDCIAGQEGATVVILQPESVAGITARFQGNDAVLQYQEISLDALLPEVAGYAPMDMLHWLLQDLQSPPTFVGTEQGSLALEYRGITADGTETLKLVYLNPQTLDLQRAECYLNDSLILALDMEMLAWQ